MTDAQMIAEQRQIDEARRQRKHERWLRVRQFFRSLVPYLDFWLDLGIISMQTEIWHCNYLEGHRVIIKLQVRVLRKWGFRLNLYKPPLL